MKSILAILPSPLVSIMLLSQTKLQNPNTNNALNTVWVKARPGDNLIKWRRNIHENAQEENTSKYVEGILKGSGNIEIIKPAKTNVIEILKGSKPGTTVAFRVDL
jgi:metal-dependent amidase/aminoacylase/carboxypeptidase family protein